MPKTTKRAATRRAAKIAKAHATELPRLEVKEAPPRRRTPGQKPPARGIARYPWATFLIIVLLALGIFALYANHVGPFALPKPKPKPVAVAPCLTSNVLKQITDVAPAPGAVGYAKIQHTYASAPAMSISTSKTYCAGINTNRGLIVVELDPKLAPQTVNNFVFLAQHQFYDGMVFHRVLKTGQGMHIIQSGDPLGNDPAKRGTGGPGYTIPAEPVQGNYVPGVIAMAKKSTDTANSGSQFFIVIDGAESLPKSYNLFGKVVQGMNVVKLIQGPGDDAASKNITPDTINHLVVVAAP